MWELKRNGVKKIKIDKVVYEQIKKDDPFNTSGVRSCIDFEYILGSRGRRMRKMTEKEKNFHRNYQQMKRGLKKEDATPFLFFTRNP